MPDNPLTPERLAELKAIAEADWAPKRPWSYDKGSDDVLDANGDYIGSMDGNNGVFVVAAVNAFDALLVMAEERDHYRAAFMKITFDTTECRRCSECSGASHHWIADPQDDPDLPEYGCKHCPQRGRECSDCDGEGCELCDGEGVKSMRTTLLNRDGTCQKCGEVEEDNG